MITYIEYVKGKDQFKSQIAMSNLYKALDPDTFYPMVSLRDDDEVFPFDYVMKLNKQMVNVFDKPGVDMITKELFIENDWAFEIIQE